MSYVYALKDVWQHHGAHVGKGDIAMLAALARSVAAIRKRRDKPA
ncbi:hypothetical protein [Zeimonas arvi]|nr:hypothetical protein [Zeimonas arvi]